MFAILISSTVPLYMFLKFRHWKILVKRSESFSSGTYLIHKPSSFNFHRKYCLTSMCLVCTLMLQLMAKSIAPLFSISNRQFCLEFHGCSTCITKYVLCTCNSCGQLGFCHWQTYFCVPLLNIKDILLKTLIPKILLWFSEFFEWF